MSDNEVRDVLVDCISSKAIHGDAAREAADYILSSYSGLTVLMEDGFVALRQDRDSWRRVAERLEREKVSAQTDADCQRALVTMLQEKWAAL